MANYCVLCGEEIPEHRRACGLCTTLMDNLPPDRAKKLQRVIEDEQARENLRAALQEVKLQLRIALSPVADAIIDFVDRVCKATEVDEDGK